MFSINRQDFGPDFVFGTATAAYQIEGGQTDGRGSSIWDTFSATPGNVKDGGTGAVACDHYNRFEEDLDLIRDWRLRRLPLLAGLAAPDPRRHRRGE